MPVYYVVLQWRRGAFICLGGPGVVPTAPITLEQPRPRAESSRGRPQCACHTSHIRHHYILVLLHVCGCASIVLHPQRESGLSFCHSPPAGCRGWRRLRGNQSYRQRQQQQQQWRATTFWGLGADTVQFVPTEQRTRGKYEVAADDSPRIKGSMPEVAHYYT